MIYDKDGNAFEKDIDGNIWPLGETPLDKAIPVAKRLAKRELKHLELRSTSGPEDDVYTFESDILDADIIE